LVLSYTVSGIDMATYRTGRQMQNFPTSLSFNALAVGEPFRILLYFTFYWSLWYMFKCVLATISALVALLSCSHCICFITVVYHYLFEQINDDDDDDDEFLAESLTPRSRFLGLSVVQILRSIINEFNSRVQFSVEVLFHNTIRRDAVNFCLYYRVECSRNFWLSRYTMEAGTVDSESALPCKRSCGRPRAQRCKFILKTTGRLVSPDVRYRACKPCKLRYVIKLQYLGPVVPRAG